MKRMFFGYSGAIALMILASHSVAVAFARPENWR